MFRFDRASHTYWRHDRQLPGITTVIRSAGHSDDEWCSLDALARGSAVHAASLLVDLGDEPEPLPEAWGGYLRAWLAFRADVPCSWTELEQPRMSEIYGFAGTPDRVGMVMGRPAIVELKTAQSGARVPWHGVQLAAQDMLLDGRRGLRQRLAVYLLPDGRYRLREYADSADYLTFLSNLQAYGN